MMSVLVHKPMPFLRSSDRLVDIACASVLVSRGCGSNDDIDRVVVSGRVTYRDEPVADGTIRFVPTYGLKLPISCGAISSGSN